VRLIINGTETDVSAETFVQLLLELGYDDMPVATALNMSVVRKKDRNIVRLKDGDRVEILVPMQGG
jgi:sulfur carrier protein